MNGMYFRYCGIMRPNNVDKTEFNRIISIAHNEQKQADSMGFIKSLSQDKTLPENFSRSMCVIKPQYRATICYALCKDDVDQFYLKVSVENQIIHPDNRSYDLAVITIKIFGFKDYMAGELYRDMIRVGSIELCHTFHGEIHRLQNLSKHTAINDTEYQFVVPHKDIDNANEFWFLSIGK